MYDYIIVGAGLFGSVFAHQARAKGKKVLVIDKRGHPGGNCFCRKIEGINVHQYGAHIFHTSDPKVWDFVNKFVELNQYINSPLAKFKGKIYNLPFNMNTFHQLWGVTTPQEAKSKLEEERARGCGDPQNLEEQAISLVGVDIYEKLIRGYTEKQWGRPCRDLPSFIIRRLPIRFRYDNNYYDDLHQGVPIDGYNRLFKDLLSGVDLKLNSDFFQGRKGYEESADRILYTGPLDQYFGYQHGYLEYRSLTFEHQVLDMENYQGNAVVNFTEREIPYTRIIEHKHFEFTQSDKTVITKEFPVEWKPGDEPYYPVNDNRNNELFLRYRKLAKKENRTLFGGRLAEYRYYDMDQVIGEALKLAEKEL